MRRLRAAAFTAVAVLLVLAAVAYGLYGLMNSRTVQTFGTLVDRVDTDEKVVALTLDDGPTARTPEVLDVLGRADVPATFYVNGKDLAAHPEYGRQIVQAGHELGNHTTHHRRMVFVSPSTVRDEVETTDDAIRAAGYDGDITFRPPYGKKLVALPHYLAEHDRTSVTWDVEPDSASQPGAYEIAENTVAHVRPGSIVLLHVMASSRQSSLDAIPDIVARLREQGYRFVTVSELLSLRD
ncbi:polysaccharide deacetylase family protein [Rhodococcus sp. HNM0569]|uniref:polysaccharide deacetylase family protein n=1 Tax=Rhodococcus sp. HNM0569 TaxID=2716340 RepID=UPI00146B6567|nr:polysaccharide deacetylase family protein [Rhodococcus sp. HNM0569]NLU84773.1 polysaccharide deacetylase family protein [Rhodococcus sp. HNM0569]